MNCPRCGYVIEGRALFCPQCGRKLDASPQALQSPQADARGEPTALGEDQVSPSAEPEPVRGQGCRTSLAVAGVAFLVVLVIGLIAVAAVYQGMRDRGEIQAEAALEHYARGEAHLAEGRYELAIAEFEHALRLNPGLVEAADRLAEVRAIVGALPTPTSVLAGAAQDALWQEMQAALAAQDWAKALEKAEQLMALDPDFRRQEVEQAVHDACYHLGLEAVQANRMEEAVRLFDRALAVRPDSAAASLAQSMAKLYMDGVRYAGVDWAAAIDRLSMLYALDPEYRDVRARLHEAYLAYAQQLTARDDWCLAALQYRRADELQLSAATRALAQEAAERCGAPPVAGTPPVPGETAGPTGTPAQDRPAVPSGTFVGRLERTEPVAVAAIYVRGRIVDAGGKGVPNVRVMIQAWDWTAYAISDGNGQFSFDGLGNPVTYTLSLPDLPSQPVEAPTAFSQLTWVVFEQVP